MASFEEFYRAVKRVMEEERETTNEEKAALFRSIEGAKPYINAIQKKQEELGLGPEECYVLQYLFDHQPEKSKPQTAHDATVLHIITMMFVHENKDVVMSLYNLENRKTMVKSLTEADLIELKIDKNSEDVIELLNKEEPTVDDILGIIGFGKLLYIYDKYIKKTYRTRAIAQELGAITELPNTLAVTTFASYQHSISLFQEGGAYLQPLSSTDGLKFKRGRMYFDGAQMREVSEVELQNMKTKEGIADIDLSMLRIFYSIILTRFEASGYTELKEVLTMSVPTLAEFMGLQSNINKKDIDRIIEKTQSYHNIIGVLNGTRNGRPAQSLFPVLNFEGYNSRNNTIKFSSPYMNYVINTVYKLSIRKSKNGKELLKKNGEPLRVPTHSYLIDSSIVKERNKVAVENVVIIVTLIEQAGNNIPRIKASTIVERNVQLEYRLEKSKNATQLLRRTFIRTWELLRENTRIKEVYKNIQLPDPKDPAAIPTMSTLNKMVFSFPHEGKIKNRK